jgi:hypothetical protein
MNTYLKSLALVAVVGFAGTSFAVADEWDKKTTITIDEPMQLPNTMLQPGTYVIKLVATSAANRHTVQFFDKDEKHVITTILAIPNERLRATGKSVFAFWETPAGQPKALRAWFYPGDNFGQEFAYPKDVAASLSASNNNVTVPINDDKSAAVTTQTAQNDDAASAPVVAAQSAPVSAPAPAPAPAPVEVAAAQTPAPAAVDTSSNTQGVDPAPVPAANTLPQTASNLPLFALIGMLSMVAALALKFAYNRS